MKKGLYGKNKASIVGSIALISVGNLAPKVDEANN